MKDDVQHLNEVETNIREQLAKLNAPVTVRNVIHMMFGAPGGGGNYADWLGGDDIYPVCSFETRWQSIKRAFHRFMGRA
jgi:hypothetical protein